VTAVQVSSAAPWPFENLVGRYEVAYRASEDALRDQRDRIDEMRGRAITLLSVAVGVLAFLGERLFDTGALRRLGTGWGPFNSHAAVAVSVVAFLVVVGSAVWVWWPVKGSFTLGALMVDTMRRPVTEDATRLSSSPTEQAEPEEQHGASVPLECHRDRFGI